MTGAYCQNDEPVEASNDVNMLAAVAYRMAEWVEGSAWLLKRGRLMELRRVKNGHERTCGFGEEDGALKMAEQAHQ